MSKKKLLEESTIRSFMKLANLQPLTDKFLKESEELEELKKESMHVQKDPDEKADSQEGTLEEEVLEEEEDSKLEEVVEDGEEAVKQEGKETEGRPSSPKAKVKGVAKPGKMDAAKNAPGDAKLKPMKQTHVHSDKPDSIEHTKKSNAPKKNNSQFELNEEMGMDTPAAPTSVGATPPSSPMEEEEMDSPEGGDESGPHKDKMKGLIRDMLNNLKQMGEEYGMSMEISDEGGASPEGDEEMAPPSPEESPAGGEGEEMMQEKLDEMVEKLTKRVAARLVKETKKKR